MHFLVILACVSLGLALTRPVLASASPVQESKALTARLVTAENGIPAGGILRRYGMWICCAAMVLPLGAYLLTSGTLGSTFQTLGLLAPLLICMGAHALMHRFTGHSCHGAHGNDRKDRFVRRPHAPAEWNESSGRRT